MTTLANLTLSVMQSRAERLGEHGADPMTFAEEDWTHDPGPRSKNRWKHNRTGRIVYAKDNPGGKSRQPKAPNAGGGDKPAKAAPTPRKGAADREKAFQSARESVQKIMGGEKTPEAARELVEHLSGLTVQQLTAIKKEFSLKASGNKAELTAKIAAKLQGAFSVDAPPAKAKAAPAVPQEPAQRPSAPAKPTSWVVGADGMPDPQTLDEIQNLKNAGYQFDSESEQWSKPGQDATQAAVDSPGASEKEQKVTAATAPDAEIDDKIVDAVAGATRRDPIELPELFRRLSSDDPGLTVGRFQDRLRELRRSRRLELDSYTGAFTEIARHREPFFVDGQVMFYAYPGEAAAGPAKTSQSKADIDSLNGKELRDEFQRVNQYTDDQMSRYHFSPDKMRAAIKAAVEGRKDSPKRSTPAVAPAAKPAPTSSPAPPLSAEEFRGELARAMKRIESKAVHPNFVSLVDLRKELPNISREDFDRHLYQLRRSGLYTTTGAEGRDGLKPEERDAGIVEDGILQLFLSRRRDRDGGYPAEKDHLMPPPKPATASAKKAPQPAASPAPAAKPAPKPKTPDSPAAKP